MDHIADIVENIIGPDSRDMEWWQMALRAFIMFFVALSLVRIAGMRTLGTKSAFDAVTLFMLGTVLARAIPGNSPFFPTIGAGLVISLLHRIIAVMAFHSHFVGKIVKGEEWILYRNGKFYRDNMKTHSISERDILESVRVRGGKASLDEIEEAWFERTGEISIISKKAKE